MIAAQYFNNQSLIGNDKAILIAMDGFGSPKIGQKSYDRSGRSGVVVNSGLYRNFDLKLIYKIIGNSVPDFIAKRDWFIGLWRLLPFSQSGEYELRTILTNESVRRIFVKQKSIDTEIKAATPTSCDIEVTLTSEKEYFASFDREVAINWKSESAEGMAVPMELPVSLNNNAGNSLNGIFGTVISNVGNTYSYPTVKVYGPFSNFSLTLDASEYRRTLTYAGSVAVNHFIYLDFYNRIVSLDGTTNKLSLVSGNWWPIPPGDSTLKFNADGGQAVISHHDAYLNV